MYLKLNSICVISFLILGAIVYAFGPGFSSWVRTLISVALYAFVFFACFVVVRRK